MVPVPEVKQAELDKWYASCMTTDAVSVFPVAPADPLPETMMDAYFVKPAPAALFDYAQTRIPAPPNSTGRRTIPAARIDCRIRY